MLIVWLLYGLRSIIFGSIFVDTANELFLLENSL